MDSFIQNLPQMWVDKRQLRVFEHLGLIACVNMTLIEAEVLVALFLKCARHVTKFRPQLLHPIRRVQKNAVLIT